MKQPDIHTITLEKIVGGGQALGTLEDGRKLFAWGGLPGEQVVVKQTKKNSRYVEGIVTEVLKASPERVEPRDPTSYLSTSPWQIIDFAAEQHYKAALIEEAFELHDIVLPQAIDVYTDDREYGYRNKVEFSWYGEADESTGKDTLHLAFFRRGSKGKLIIDDFALLPEPMMKLAREIRDHLQSKGAEARQLKTLLIRCDQSGSCVWQLYIKVQKSRFLTEQQAAMFSAQGGEVIYSDPRSPASRITERLFAVGDIVLNDTVLGIPFHYATEGFFQINIPVYEQALRDMHGWLDAAAAFSEGSDLPSEPGTSQIATSGPGAPEEKDSGHVQPRTVDLYSGVGTIGLTIGGPGCILVELNEDAVREMRRNIAELGSNAEAVLAPTEKALEYIVSDKTIIVDPPRAGLHADVVAKLLEVTPGRIIYLSCNPVTQARDVALLAESYGIRAHRGYNFFPHTPHIEHVVVLDRK